MTAVLANLLGKVHNLKAQVNTAKSPFLRMLPAELIAEIFLFCLEIPAPDDEPREVDSSIPLKLGSVCTGFRAIAWSTPSLWSAVVLNIKAAWKIPSQSILLSDWLTRSGHLPLSIWLSSSENVHWTFARPESLLKVINAFSSRWRYVDIRLPSSCYGCLPPSNELLPMLQSLTLKPPGGQGDRTHQIDICTAPLLKRISLQCLYLRSIKFAWDVLTTLELDSFYIDESLEMLHQASNLANFNLRCIIGGDDSHLLPEEPIVRPSLCSLTLVNDKPTDISVMLNKITTPSLRELRFTADGITYAPSSPLINLFIRSSCPLKTLSLSQCSIISGTEFKHLLSLVPSLEHLHLDMMTAPAYSAQLEIAPLTDDIIQSCNPLIAQENKQVCLLPNLEVLSYRGIQRFSWTLLLQMIETRTAPLVTSQSSAILATSRTRVAQLKEVNLHLTRFAEDGVSDVYPLNAPHPKVGLKFHLETVIIGPL